MSVDLPDPDWPMMATNSPRHTEKLTPASARTSDSPLSVYLGQILDLYERALIVRSAKVRHAHCPAEAFAPVAGAF